MSGYKLEEFLKAGTHFGHQTKRWNPKMRKFILCPRKGIYIIDLNKTIKCLDGFIDKVKSEVENGGVVLFVGTKKQIKESVREEAIRCGMPYVTERWLGGMLTNFNTIRKSIKKLDDFEAMEENGTMDALPKREALSLKKKREKLLSFFSGIRDMKKPPDVIFVVDSIKENIAISEARKLNIPLGAIVDTNCDPDPIDYPIPGNDDAIKSVHIIIKSITDAIVQVKNDMGVEIQTGTADEKTAEDTSEEKTEEKSEEANDNKEESKKKRRVVRKKMVSVDKEK